MTTDDHAWLTVPEAARELRVSVPTIWRWIRAGRLAASRVGVRSVRVRRSDLTATRRALEPSRRGVVNQAVIEKRANVEPDHGRPSMEEALLRLKELRERTLARRGGVPLPDSVEAIREAREERYNDL